MITQEDRNLFRDVGREYLLDIAFDSKVIKENLTFKEHLELCEMIMNLSYKDIVELTINEGIKEFENKFKTFLKYSFAAIAGAASGAAGAASILVAPPIAMFILYTFRKLTDTCSRACLNKFPMSAARKICRYECQVNATKKIVNDLRSEINKCNSFPNPEKCQKKLSKEYIKWSRRLQQQIVKYRQAKLGQEQKDRKKMAKNLSKKARSISASLQIPKSQLLNVVSEGKIFRDNLSFRDHIKIYNAVKSIKEDDDLAVKPPKINPKIESWARKALYLGLWVVPIPFFNDVVNYIIKKYNFACASKCLAQRKYSKKLCVNQCSYLSAKYGVQLLNKQLAKCAKSNKPVKCKNKIFKLLEDWKQREAEYKIKFDLTLKNELRAAKQQNRIKGKV